jgi:tetratricopeptide (TPR) repeat protein
MKRVSTADSIVRLCAAVLPALLLVFFVPVTSVTVAQAKMILVAVIVLVGTVAWGVARYRDRILRVRLNLLVIAVVLLPFAYALSALMNGAPAGSIASGLGGVDSAAAMCLFAGCFMLWALTFEQMEGAALLLLRSLAVSGTVLLVLQLIHLFVPGISFGVFSGAATSIFGTWHEFGIITGLLFFLGVALWETSIAEESWKWLFRALTLLSFFFLFIVNLQDVWYTLGATLIIFGLFGWLTSERSFSSTADPATRAIVTFVVGLIALASGFGGGFIYNHLPSPLQVLSTEVRPSWGGTFAIGKGVYTGVMPALFGSGPDTFTREWSLYKPAEVNSTDYWNVDFNAGVGFIPTTLVTTGLIGLLAWGLLALAFIMSFLQFVRARMSPSSRSIAAALFAASLYLIAFHVLYVPAAGLSALMFVFLGCVALGEDRSAARVIPLRTYDWKGIARVVVLLCVLMVLIIASIATLRDTASDIAVNQSAADYAQTGDSTGPIALVSTALFLNPHNDRAERAGVELGLIELNTLTSQTASSTAELQSALQAAIQHGLAAVSIDRGDYQNWLALAGLYQDLAGAGVQGAYENAKAAYTSAQAENPTNPLPLLQMAQLDIAQKDPTDALSLLDQAIGLKKDYFAAYFLRSQVEAGQGNFTTAAQDATTAAQGSPDDSQNWYNLGAILYAAGSYSDAVTALEHAVALQGDYANALFVLGLSYDKLGRPDDALGVLQKASNLNPTDMTVVNIIRNIQAGKPALYQESTTTPAVVTPKRTP